MSIFKEMKRTKEWEQWDTQFRADVTTQGLSNVLDPNYIPATYDDKMLFREQQHYMYAVFIRVLKMDKGKAIVHKYKGTFDAQSIYCELQEYASKSIQASLIPTPSSSISPLPSSGMVPGMVRLSSLSSIGWSKFGCMKNSLTSPPLCPTL